MANQNLKLRIIRNQNILKKIGRSVLKETEELEEEFEEIARLIKKSDKLIRKLLES